MELHDKGDMRGYGINRVRSDHPRLCGKSKGGMLCCLSSIGYIGLDRIGSYGARPGLPKA